MSVEIVNPAYLTVKEWTDFMVPALEQFGNLGRLDDEKQWREWGAALLNLPALSGSVIPDPYQFDDWRTWATRCVQNLSEMP